MLESISVKHDLPLTAYERKALQQRISQIVVALGHPRRTVKQAAVLIRERAALESKLAAH
jgi:hypothetical protein